MICCSRLVSNITMANINTLMNTLKKADMLVDEMYAEYMDTKSKYGEGCVASYYLEKYEKARKNKEDIKSEICKAEQNLKLQDAVKAFLEDAPPIKVPRTKRIRDLEDPSDTDKNQQIMTQDDYRPRKVQVTSSFGIKYRNDPKFREHVRLNARRRYLEKKELAKFIVPK